MHTAHALLLPPIQIVSRFDKSKYIVFFMH
jgi:hypothetical protein